MHTRVAIARSATLVLLAAMAACTGGFPVTPSPEASDPASSVSPSAAAAVAGSVSAPASPAPARTSPPTPVTSGIPTLPLPTATLPARPPIAILTGLAGEPTAGDLGTVSWGGLTSDAPWIVGRAGGRATPAAWLGVRFDPTLVPVSWQARWAPVTGQDTAAPRDGGSGSDEAIFVVTPDTPGAWSLQVEARFGPDTSGAWYWQVRVGE